jgi:hypothetical protein
MSKRDVIEALSILGLMLIGAVFLGAAYLSYQKEWRAGAYICVVVAAVFLLVAVPATRGFLRTTAWAAFVTALESTGQGLTRLSRTIDDIRDRMKHDQQELDQVQKETRTMQNSLRTAQTTLQKQQAKIGDLDQLLKAFYEARKTQVFDTKEDSDRLIALEHDASHGTIYVLLSLPPIPQTVDVQWHVFAQPKNAYFLQGNVLVFRWGQSIPSFRAQQLTVTYVAEPKEKAAYSRLSKQTGRVYADDKPMIYGYANLDPVVERFLRSPKGPPSEITLQEFETAVRAEASPASPSP